MHILMLVVIGLVVLAVFLFGARLLNRSEKSGATAFIWVWLVASIINGAFGVMRVGIPIVNEIGAFVPILASSRGTCPYRETGSRAVSSVHTFSSFIAPFFLDLQRHLDHPPDCFRPRWLVGLLPSPFVDAGCKCWRHT
jgi:hypothetical protein